MKFIVDKQVLQHYPSLHLGVIVLKDFDNSKRVSVISNILRGVYVEKKRDFIGKKIDEDARINVWKKTYKSFDFDSQKHTSAFEKLLKDTLQDKGVPSNNTLKDICEIISLKYCVPIQVHDTDHLAGDFKLSYADGSEFFKEIANEKPTQVPKGEIVYKDEAGVLSRGWNWKYSVRTSITANTLNAMVVIEDMGVLGSKKLEDAIRDFIYLIQKYEHSTSESHIISHFEEVVDLGVEGMFGISDDESGELHIFEKKSISKEVKKQKKKVMDYENYLQKIGQLLKKHLKKEFTTYADTKFSLEETKDTQYGDYACNVAMQIAQKEKTNPRELAEKIIAGIKKPIWIEKLEVAGPGFINIHLSKRALSGLLQQINDFPQEYGKSQLRKEEKILVEFAHPNTHKAFHIGHMRNISLGESLVRLLESQGVKVYRANYQGDVGPHVAKCLWGYMKTEVPKDLDTPQKKAEFLGKVYAIGSKAYEASEETKKEIDEINKQVYQEDQDIIPLWKETRQWSLDYFDTIYKKLGSHFDRLYFESEVWKKGYELVQEGLTKGVFEKSDGAIVYNGEKHGLHKRVFITAKDTVTYEGKEVGLAILENSEFDFDKKIHIVAHEQSAYFQVVFHAIEDLAPELKGRQEHVPYGMVKLPSGKMSSRTGDVITAESLLEEARNKVEEYIGKLDLSEEEKADISEKVSIGAVKFAMLNATSASDIIFDMEKATKLEGATGPYLQYACARINSILKKCEDIKESDTSKFNDHDWLLIRKMMHFPEVNIRATTDLSPHHLTRYLLELAAEFSSWYDKNSVMKAEDGLREARVELVKALSVIVKSGLSLLGLQAPERM